MNRHDRQEMSEDIAAHDNTAHPLNGSGKPILLECTWNSQDRPRSEPQTNLNKFLKIEIIHYVPTGYNGIINKLAINNEKMNLKCQNTYRSSNTLQNNVWVKGQIIR